ncbi:hypothetical protein ACIQUM_42785 [Amycolatopsis azurea]|uniref:hypothetical protein n=1 Tax=Amycolatopsis azurea TaxID=36819 RepID=UPI0038095E39
MSEAKGFYLIIEYAVDGSETQAALVDAFVGIQDRWVRFYPGYVSARFHASIDGTWALQSGGGGLGGGLQGPVDLSSPRCPAAHAAAPSRPD